jgi:hypothetical protein
MAQKVSHESRSELSSMKDRQFEQFATEVLNKGAVAVLPQNLPERWLNALLEEAEILQQEEGDDIENTCAGLLGAVILILFSQQSGHPSEIEVAATTLLRYMDYYIITLSAEIVSRKTDIWVEPPTLENIFQEDREMKCMRKSAET